MLGDDTFYRNQHFDQKASATPRYFSQPCRIVKYWFRSNFWTQIFFFIFNWRKYEFSGQNEVVVYLRVFPLYKGNVDDQTNLLKRKFVE